MLNQQPVPAAYRLRTATMADAETVRGACREVRNRFEGERGYKGLSVDDVEGGVTITVHRQGMPVTTLGWQEQCNEIERAIRISSPYTDLMIVVA